MSTIIECEDILLREMSEDDLPALKDILQDAEVMYAYEHAFSDEEAAQWLQRQQERYREDGFGLWALVCRDSGRMVGQCGLTWQVIPGAEVVEVGYLLRKDHWHKGLAVRAASVCVEYAFSELGFDEVYAIIRTNNLASIKVAARLGMTRRGEFKRHYYGIDMLHAVYSRRRDERE